MKVTPQILPSTWRAVMGGAVWLGFACWTVSDLRSFSWSTALLEFSALVLMPLLLELVSEPHETPRMTSLWAAARWLQFPAALLLLTACARVPGWLTALLAIPWIVVTGLLASLGLMRILSRGIAPVWALCRDGGLVFIVIGGAWTLADRLGIHPLGFGTGIVQLTAVHFHFAGLALPVVAGMVVREFPLSRTATVAGKGVLAGVPLVAVGITSSQLGQTHAIEFFAGVVLAGSAMVVAMFQLHLAAETRWRLGVRVGWTISGFSLLFGMVLALLYSGRPYFLPLPWLDLPWMRALHGTANALGFALCGTIGWRTVHSERRLG